MPLCSLSWGGLCTVLSGLDLSKVGVRPATPLPTGLHKDNDLLRYLLNYLAHYLEKMKQCNAYAAIF